MINQIIRCCLTLWFLLCFTLKKSNKFNPFDLSSLTLFQSWSGALCSASASSEFCTLALALSCSIEVLSLKTGEKRMILIDKTFFNDTNGSKTTLKSDDVIIQLITPKLSKVRCHHIDHEAISSAAFAVVNFQPAYSSWKRGNPLVHRLILSSSCNSTEHSSVV